MALELEKLAQVMGEGGAEGAPRVPKYVVLSDQIISDIESGNLASGQQLPGEAEMAAALPASLGTIQKAMTRLVDQGMVVRRHGSGTFVSDGRQQLNDLWHFRFLADDGETLLPIFTTVEEIGTIQAEGPWSEFLGADKEYVCIERKIDVNHEFCCFARFLVLAETFPKLSGVHKSKLDNVNFRAFLRESYGVSTVRVAEQIAAETMPGDICGFMDIAPSSIGMVCHLQGYGYKDEPVSYQLAYIPPNSRRLQFGPKRD